MSVIYDQYLAYGEMIEIQGLVYMKLRSKNFLLFCRSVVTIYQQLDKTLSTNAGELHSKARIGVLKA